jgi:YbbR domain-containing protein
MAERPALLRNLGLKVLALAIALIVWFVFAAQRRERISERTYAIPLSLVNIPPRMVVASPLPPSVEVRVRGPFTALRQLDPAKLEAVIDLADATRGEKLYRLAPEDINVPQEVEVIAISPAQFRIVLDAMAEKSVPIVPNVIGQPSPGHEVTEVVVEPRYARLTGPASILSPMSQVTTDPVSIGDRSATLSVPATVLPDTPGVRVKEGQIVTVTVRIQPMDQPTPTPAPAPKTRRR